MNNYGPTTELLMNPPRPLHVVQQPPSTTFPDLLKVMEHEFLTSVFKNEDTDRLDNACAQMPNNNNEAGKPPCDMSTTKSNGKYSDIARFSEELSISVDSEEESGHSWRPSITNALSPDFFLKPPDPVKSDQVPVPLTPEEELERSVCFRRVNQSIQGTQSIQVLQETGYVQSQKAKLNILKYEVTSAQRKVNDSRTEIRELSYRLNEESKFQNSPEIKTLTLENAQLRLECQCLCMEVDFYLRGQAPLGEVDENFYKEKSSSAEITQAEPKPSQPECRSGDYAAEELEEGNKWECHQCTFANHPAINSCEMCHVARHRRGSQQPVHCSSQDTCFCHPRENAQSS